MLEGLAQLSSLPIRPLTARQAPLFRRFQVAASLLLSILFVGATAQTAPADPFVVDPRYGDAGMNAVYDFAPTGDRITAASSGVTCELDIQPQGSASGTCRIPLTSIIVDEEPTRTRHFYEWVTHKEKDSADCAFELKLTNARVSKAVYEERALPFETEGTFSVCGRTRKDGASEKITGVVTVIPAGGESKTVSLRIRARIAGFDREKYEIGPQFTPGWLARIPKISEVVAPVGDIEVNLVAVPREKKR